MAGLAAKFGDTLNPEIKRFIKIFPELNKDLLGMLGARIGGYLDHEFLSGQELTLRVKPLDSKGHRTISHTVNRRATHVKVFSYPINFFENGRTLRSGKREPAKKIYPKLRAVAMARMGTDIMAIEKRTYESYLKSRGF